ncbi:hypothetical protein L2750_03300 [Shewanella submarina]|uniref:MFS transporter n=1 Tax=Shewanella submarina TaxID=2016376 RepID=A0ABV7GJQ0_9GAMM|nr:MFS transporter [Shewanella submarina]MCL1036183.1 hypothetical protein [Shewanella submarina]
MEVSHSNYLHNFSFLAFARFFESMGYYAMRAVLVLYLTDVENGAGVDQENAFELYATFTTFVILAQLAGGFLSDLILGTARTLLIGGLCAIVGYLMLAAQFDHYLAVGLIAFGSGCFVSSHWGILGQVFNQYKNKLDGAMLLVYFLINFGALLSGIVAGYGMNLFSWSGSFMAAFVAQLCGLLCILATYRKLPSCTYSRSIAFHKQDTPHTSIIWVVAILALTVVITLVGDLDQADMIGKTSVQYVYAPIATMMLVLLLLGLLFWFWSCASTPKLIVAVALYLIGYFGSGLAPAAEHQWFMAYALGYLAIVGLVEALMFPISMSILLQRTDPRFIATTAAALSAIPAGIAGLITWIV